MRYCRCQHSTRPYSLRPWQRILSKGLAQGKTRVGNHGVQLVQELNYGNENSEKKAAVPKSVSFIVHSCAASSVARPCAKLLLGSQIVKGCSSQQG